MFAKLIVWPTTIFNMIFNVHCPAVKIVMIAVNVILLGVYVILCFYWSKKRGVKFHVIHSTVAQRLGYFMYIVHVPIY